MSVIDSLSLGGTTYSLRDNDGRAIIAGTESSTTSAHAYSAGDYFILNDTLYEATAAIAVGGTITVGTNCQATTVCGEVGQLKSDIAELVVISDTEPSSEYNKIWIDSTSASVQVPTVEDVAANMAKKADINGSYPDLTAGNADQLIATVGAEEKVPYIFRVSGGTADIGNRENNKLVGGTLAWNQLVDSNTTSVTLTSGHKYLTCVSGVWSIVTGAGSAVAVTGGADQVFDLTQMFGSTIADYVSGLETANAGAGVTWFRKLFQKSFYAFNPGELLSVQAAAHKMVGFNLLKESYGYAATYTPTFSADKAVRVIRGQTYEYSFEQITGATSWRNAIVCYNLDGAKINSQSGCLTNFAGTLGYNVGGDYYVSNSNGTSKSEKFTAMFDGYIIPYYLLGDTSASTPIVNPCVHLRLNSERDGEYKLYQEWNYPLDDSLTLRGIPKLDASNNLYYDGDTYESNGKVTRRYGVKTFTGSEADSEWYSVDVSSGKTRAIYQGISSLVKTGEYLAPVSNAFVYQYSSNPDVGYCAINAGGNLIVGLPSTVTTKAQATAYMASVSASFVYELASPTTESADPYQNPQIVDDFGTEEYVDAGVTADPPTRDVAIPVGHDTFYMENLRDKLQHLPIFPTLAGTYHLKVTVSDGIPAYSWESDA